MFASWLLRGERVGAVWLSARRVKSTNPAHKYVASVVVGPPGTRSLRGGSSSRFVLPRARLSARLGMRGSSPRASPRQRST